MTPSVRIGIDEVARGCVWGPLIVGAVAIVEGSPRIDNVRDSKTIKSQKVRGRLAEKIKAAHAWSIYTIPSNAVEQFGVDHAQRAATEKAMDDLIARARAAFPQAMIHVTLDGDVRELPRRDGVWIENVPQADAKVYEVSAASILAIAEHDRWVDEYVAGNPSHAHYAFKKHRGYGTPEHASAIARHGLTSHHRTSFATRLIKTFAEKRRATTLATAG
jgi:ribonuclease HII